LFLGAGEYSFLRLLLSLYTWKFSGLLSLTNLHHFSRSAIYPWHPDEEYMHGGLDGHAHYPHVIEQDVQMSTS